jgi:hypothetical protein
MFMVGLKLANWAGPGNGCQLVRSSSKKLDQVNKWKKANIKKKAKYK